MQNAAVWLAIFTQVWLRAQSCVFIRDGTVINADARIEADVLITGGVIDKIGKGITVPPTCTTIDASGKYVMPGGIDPHTHLAMPFMGTTAVDDFFSGQAAALAGGTTMHIDFVLPHEGSIAAGLARYREKAAVACMDYGFHVAVTSWSDAVAADMRAAVQQGINSFKFFLAYKGALMVTDDQFLQGLRLCKELRALAMVHAENGEAVALGQAAVFEAGITGPAGHALSRPALLEGEATGRAVRLAEFVGTPLYVVHVMSTDALEEVVLAKERGARVVGEPVTSGLALDETFAWAEDFRTAAQYVMSPPIRAREHGVALRKALAAGLLQLVATDHAVFNSTQKALGRGDFRKIPNGVNGIEERLHVVWEEMVNSGMMGPQDFVRVVSTEAAKTFNIFPRKGIIAEGSDADVIVFDPERSHTISAATHHSRMDTNVYEGRSIRGKVVTTVSRGRVVWHDGRLNVEAGTGRFVETPVGGRLFEGLKGGISSLQSAQPTSPQTMSTMSDEL